MSSEFKYFTFCKDLGYPIYFKVDTFSFSSNLIDILKKMNFSEIDFKEIKKDKNHRIIAIQSAGPRAKDQIGRDIVEDKYGYESVTPRNGYRVYRYRGMALLVYSFATSEWELGALPIFGEKDFEIDTKIILTRSLSLALPHLGLVGFWSQEMDDGKIVVAKQKYVKGEAIFVDIRKRKIISEKGIRDITTSLSLIRLDKTLRDRVIGMKSDEILGFLMNKSTFFDYGGLITSVKQLIQAVHKISRGEVHPISDVMNKVDLSY